MGGVAVAQNGQTVAAQAEDGRVHLLQLEMLKSLHVLDGLGPVSKRSVPDFSPDGVHIVARGARSLRCWNASSGELESETRFEEQASGPKPALSICWNLPRMVSAHRDGYV